MNDEVRQIREEIFTRIVLGIILIGLITGIAALLTDGMSSPWFIRAVALLIVGAVVFAIRAFGRFVVASYVLVLQLIGLVGEMLLQPGAVTSFAPYFLIPIVVIAGFLLSPVGTIAITLFSVLVVLLVVAVTGQLTLPHLVVLLSPLGLTLFVGFLIAEGKRYANKWSQLLFENRKILKDRTLELMEAKQTTEGLQRQVTELRNRQGQVNTQATQTQWLTAQRENRLYELIKGTNRELDASVKKLEQVIEQIGEWLSSSNRSDLLKAAWSRTDHLKTLVVNLEEMTQIEHGEVKLTYRTIDVERLFGEVISTARGLARNKNLEIRCQVPENLPPLPADPVRLRQVLLHLLQNAIKYTDQGIIELQAELTNGGEMLIFVSDTGIGMHREEAELVFEKFGRGSGTLAQQRQGTGLGLTICKRLVELHGGRMWVTSVLGIGSTFYLALPLEVTREKSRETPTVIDTEAVPAPLEATPQSAPAPTLATEMAPANEGATLTMPRPAPAPLPSDNEETMLSPGPKPGSASHPVQPIHRYGPTYIRRFGIILLGLLLLVVIIVAGLAVINYPAIQEAAKTATFAASSLAVSPTPATNTPLLAPTEAPAQAPADTPSPTLQSTAGILPTEPPQSVPTDTPTRVLSVSQVTATPTSVPTQESTPTSLPSPTHTPTTTPPPTSTPTAVSPPTSTPTPVLSAASQLTFISGQAGRQTIAGFDFNNNVSPDSVVEIVENSRLSWSPTGQVLFTGDQSGDREIFLADRSTGRLVNLTAAAGDDLQPSWSPDGSKIAFSSGRTGNFEIYVMDADGSNLVQLTDSRGFDEWPVWSPDGRNIAFVSDRDGNVEIYVMNVDGSNQQRLTHHPADDWPAAWSSDSSQLVFASERDGNWNLYVIKVEGGSAQRLTNAPGAERDPAWSPDGQMIAFAYNDNGNWNIYTLPAPTNGVTEVPLDAWTQITNTPTDERYPTWPQ